MDGDAEDKAPNALKGYLEGGATATTDRNGNEGKALLFDGVDDKVTVNHNELLYSEDLTVSAWIKAPAQNTGGGVIVGKHGGGNTNQRSWLMSTSSVGPNDRLQVVVSESADNSKLKLYYSSIGILDNTWHHVAFTFADNELKLYIDGVEDLGVTKFKDDVVNSPNNSTADLTIGWRIQDDAESNFFKGAIDEVGIFDRVFSAADIAALADDTNPLEISREEMMVAGRGLNNYDYGFRIYNPALGKFLSVDPLTMEYPSLSPYPFAMNRPIDGIDLDGLEWFGKTTGIYGEIGASAGLGYGGAVAIKIGTAYDMVGTTRFILGTILTPFDQEVYDHHPNLKTISGAEISAVLGFEIIDEPTFLRAEQAKGTSIPTDAGLKYGAGVGLTLSDQIFGMDAGFGLGASIKTGDQDDIIRSISITTDEDEQIAFGENWFGGISNIKAEKDKQGNVVGFSATLELRDSDSSYKQRSYTNIPLYSGVKINSDGEKVSNEIWQSKDYIKEAKEYTD